MFSNDRLIAEATPAAQLTEGLLLLADMAIGGAGVLCLLAVPFVPHVVAVVVLGMMQ